jgi:hypothetical protein
MLAGRRCHAVCHARPPPPSLRTGRIGRYSPLDFPSAAHPYPTVTLHGERGSSRLDRMPVRPQVVKLLIQLSRRLTGVQRFEATTVPFGPSDYALQQPNRHIAGLLENHRPRAPRHLLCTQLHAFCRSIPIPMKVGLSITASLSRSAERDQQQNGARRLIFLSPKRKGATTAPAALHPRRGCQPDRVGGCRGSMSGYAAFSLRSQRC